MTMNRILFAVALVLTGLYLFPLYWMYVTSLKSESSIFAVPPEFLPGAPRWITYAEVWQTTNIPRYLWNSLVIASGTAKSRTCFRTRRPSPCLWLTTAAAWADIDSLKIRGTEKSQTRREAMPAAFFISL